MVKTIGWRLEKYTTRYKNEVLIVNLEDSSGQEDTVLIYNGFSGSLVKNTTYDPDIPVIEDDARIIAIDRLASPYDPVQPQYIQKGLTIQEMEKLLSEAGF